MIKTGACVIDVGFRRIAPGRFVGDVDFEAAREVAGWLTPNPGGTGPMTVLALMQNLIDAARYQLGLDAIRRIPRFSDQVEKATARFWTTMERHKLYISEHGDDMPEVRDWRWTL